jgi:hypothetical protein
MFPIHIAQRYDILARELSDITGPHAPNADTGDIKLFARRNTSRTAQHGARDDGKRRSGRGSA